MTAPAMGPADHPRLHISVIGGFSMTRDGRVIDLPHRKAQALLAYVALSPSGREGREKLAGLLWSGVSDVQARGSLRQALKQIRTVLDETGPPVLDANRDVVWIDKEQTVVDAWSLLESARAGRPDEALSTRSNLAETLLQGLDDLDSSFQSWLAVQRQVLHEQIVFSLQNRLTEVQVGAAGEDEAQAQRLATALLTVDPTHEGACRELMLIQARQGETAGALRRYRQLWDLLDQEYDMEPSEETQALVARIKSGDIPAVAPRPSVALAIAPSTPALGPRLIVAPAGRMQLIVGIFENTGVDASRRYLVDGFRHQLISGLVRFREWSVIDGKRPVPGREPVPGRSTYAVSASAYEADDHLRIVVTLSDQDSGEVIWSEDYGAGLSTWFATQRLIVRRLAIAINVQISVERVSQLLADPNSPLPVYDLWLKGQDLAQRWRSEEQLQANDIFRTIIDQAPQFSPAYCSLVNFANSHHLIFPGILRTAERTRNALELAKKAVKVGPTNSRAHLCAAWSFALSGEFEQAELSYQMAYELNENDPWTLISTSLGLAFLGNREKTMERLATILDLGLTTQPLHWCYQVVCRVMCEDYEGAVWASARAEDAIYNIPAWTATALAHLGRLEEARQEALRFVHLVRIDWHGTEPPADEAIVAWLLQSFPIRHRADWERLRDGLAMAGLPVDGTVSGPP